MPYFALFIVLSAVAIYGFITYANAIFTDSFSEIQPGAAAFGLLLFMGGTTGDLIVFLYALW